MKSQLIKILTISTALAWLTAACTPIDNSNATANRAVVNANLAAASNANAMSNANSMSNANATGGATNPMVGGAPMYPDKDIIENAMNSKDHTTLVAAVKAAGLVDTLKGAGPFTVFAPTNAAFEKLPKGTVDNLLKPANKATLTKILTYHVVPGKQDAAAIAEAIKSGNGKATFKTVQGGILTASMDGKDVILTDEKGGKSKVTIADVRQSNGVIHVVDSVLMPK
jgi:uncharacterized surface protein with fasciclin (FAS1) repeats